MTNWNFAEVWDVVADEHPEREAVVHGDVRLSWADLARRAEALAAGLLGAGLRRQSKVVQYLYNSPEYLESVYASFKSALVPVNTNYRYGDDELTYLWANADAEAVVFHGSFSERAGRVRQGLPEVKVWLWVDDEGGDCPEWAVPYEDLAGAGGSSGIPGPPDRGGDDLLLVYTGGTTGAPKGVMWRQDDLFALLNRTGELRYPEAGSLEEVRATLSRPQRHPPPRLLPGPPLMHGTGMFTAMSVLSSAGTVILPEPRHFDPESLLDLVQGERVSELSIVGDAFAKPILAALDAEPDRWDLSSLWLVMSSGVMWTAEVKEGLMRHNPKLTLVDTLGSSEAIGMARSTTREGSTAETAGFELGPDTKVITEDGREVEPGSGEQGRLTLGGRGPVGYYKDPVKSASTFVIIEGRRWTIPGDFATVRSDLSVALLGRGSACINTGGEKVYPEEVEEVLKLHPTIGDAVVVGVPDERFGEAVTAVVEIAPGGDPSDDGDIIGWVRSRLAGYKAPRQVIRVASINRSPAGKVDYQAIRELALAKVRASSPGSQT